MGWAVQSLNPGSTTVDDITLKIDSSELSQVIEKTQDEVEELIKGEVADIVNKARTKILENAAGGIKNESLLGVYEKNLSFVRLDETSWLIELGGTVAPKIEEGSSGFDMREVLLKSKALVSAGKNVGKPWVKHTYAGYSYANVPIEKIATVGGDLANTIKAMSAKNVQGKNTTLGEIVVNAATGKPLEGMVSFSAKSLGADFRKYQSVVNGEVKSLYIKYRRISNSPRGKGGWRHPGFSAVDAFYGMEEFIKAEFDTMILRVNK